MGLFGNTVFFPAQSERLRVSTLTFTYDPRYGLTLVTGETVVLDLVGVCIEQTSDGKFSCSVTRSDGQHPVRLVASATPEGRAIERANGRECPAVPGFVEAADSPTVGTASVVRDEIARAFGWEPEPAPLSC